MKNIVAMCGAEKNTAVVWMGNSFRGIKDEHATDRINKELLFIIQTDFKHFFWLTYILKLVRTF